MPSFPTIVLTMSLGLVVAAGLTKKWEVGAIGVAYLLAYLITRA